MSNFCYSLIFLFNMNRYNFQNQREKKKQTRTMLSIKQNQSFSERVSHDRPHSVISRDHTEVGPRYLSPQIQAHKDPKALQRVHWQTPIARSKPAQITWGKLVTICVPWLTPLSPQYLRATSFKQSSHFPVNNHVFS